MNPARSPPVVIFTTPTCSWCRRAKQYLTEKHVAFREVDVSRDERSAREVVRMTGQTGVPVVLIGNQPVVGFDKPRIDHLLRLNLN